MSKVSLFTTSDNWEYFYLNGRFYCQRDNLLMSEPEILTCSKADVQQELSQQWNLFGWQIVNCRRAGLDVSAGNKDEKFE